MTAACLFRRMWQPGCAGALNSLSLSSMACRLNVLRLRVVWQSTASFSSSASDGSSSTKVSPAPKQWRVLFMGTDFVSLSTLQLLHQNQRSSSLDNNERIVSHLEVLCSERPHSVRNFSMENKIPIHSIPAHTKSLSGWRCPKPIETSVESFDIAVVVSFGYFVPKTLLQELPYGGINMHPSRLPQYRGPAPLYHTLLNGDRQSAISINELDPNRFDAGRILRQVPVDIPENIMLFPFAKMMAEKGAQEIMYTLKHFDELRKTAIVQDEQRVTKARKIRKEDGLLCFERMSREDIMRRWRAFGDTIGVFAYLKERPSRRLAFLELSACEPPEEDSTREKLNHLSLPPSSTVLVRAKGDQYELRVKCADGKWVASNRLRFDCKAPIDAYNFWNGYSKYRTKGNICLHIVDNTTVALETKENVPPSS